MSIRKSGAASCDLCLLRFGHQLVRFSAHSFEFGKPLRASKHKRRRLFAHPKSTNFSTKLRLKPSISIALREAKCEILAFTFAGQSGSGSASRLRPPDAQPASRKRTFFRKFVFALAAGRAAILLLAELANNFTALFNQNPIAELDVQTLDFVFVMREARATVVPASKTGSRYATGVSAPVRPIWT